MLDANLPFMCSGPWGLLHCIVYSQSSAKFCVLVRTFEPTKSEIQ